MPGGVLSRGGAFWGRAMSDRKSVRSKSVGEGKARFNGEYIFRKIEIGGERGVRAISGWPEGLLDASPAADFEFSKNVLRVHQALVLFYNF